MQIEFGRVINQLTIGFLYLDHDRDDLCQFFVEKGRAASALLLHNGVLFFEKKLKYFTFSYKNFNCFFA